MPTPRSVVDSSSDPQPGPRGFPLLGNTLSFVRDPLAFLDTAREYGDVVGYDAFGRRFVVLFDPALVETVLVSRSDAFWRGEFESEFGETVDIEGVFFAEGDDWRRQRLLLQSSFTPDRIESYADDMVTETAHLVEEWDDGQVIDVREAFSTLTLRVLTRSLFDLELDGERAACVRQWARTMGEYIDTDAFGARSLLPDWVPSRTERAFDQATSDLETLVDHLVAERRRSEADGDDLLSVLSSAEAPDGSRLPADEITDQLLTFLLAGHETTATALTYVCWLLAGTDDAQTRLADELEAVCGGRDPTAADLTDLHRTEASCREALRLYPPFPFLHREPHETIHLGGYRIDPGTTVQLPMYRIHRDERWWAAPRSFRPGRWLECPSGADGATRIRYDDERPEYAYFPFGGGPRHCIGMRFAMTELQLSLATLVRRIEFERVTDSIDPTLKVSLDPGPVELRVRTRID